MLNSSPSNSFSVKLKSRFTNSISVLTQQKQKQWKTLKKQKHKPISKKSSSKTIKHNNPFPKTLLPQQSNTTTKEKQRNQQTQANPRPSWGFARTGSNLGFAGVAGSNQNCEEGFVGVDRMIGGSLSLCLVPYLSFPTEAHLGFAWIRSDLGFARVCWRVRTEVEFWTSEI